MKKILILLLFITRSYGVLYAQDPGIDMQFKKGDSIKSRIAGTTDLWSAVRESNVLYGKAFINGDSLLFIERYDVNASIMPPNTVSLTGPGAASSFFTVAYHQMHVRNVILSTKELYEQGSFATEVGNFELLDIKGHVINRGKYIVLWKCTDGKWGMYRDCFNSDLK